MAHALVLPIQVYLSIFQAYAHLLIAHFRIPSHPCGILIF